jgi:hypothetical protein
MTSGRIPTQALIAAVEAERNPQRGENEMGLLEDRGAIVRGLIGSRVANRPR